MDLRSDTHVEHTGTRIDRTDAGGFNSRVGVRVFGQGSGEGNAVRPYAAVKWLRGARRNALAFSGERLEADMPRNRYEVQAGAELVLGQRWTAWGGLTVQRGEQDYRNVGAQVGMRVRW